MASIRPSDRCAMPRPFFKPVSNCSAPVMALRGSRCVMLDIGFLFERMAPVIRDQRRRSRNDAGDGIPDRAWTDHLDRRLVRLRGGGTPSIRENLGLGVDHLRPFLNL